jgi:ribosomal protein L40E
MENSLCLRCGDAGHMAAECRCGGNIPRPKPKLQAATITPVAPTVSATSSPTAGSGSGKA